MSRARVFSTLFLLLVACCVGPNAGEHVRIDLSSAPQFAFTDHPLQLRLRLYVDREPPLDPSRRATKPVTVTVTTTLNGNGRYNGFVIGEGDGTQLALPPYNDEASPLRYSLSPEQLRQSTGVDILVSGAGDSAIAQLQLRAASQPGGDLVARDFSLCDADGNRATIVLDRWDESQYRRWTIPHTLARWWQTPQRYAAFAITPHAKTLPGTDDPLYASSLVDAFDAHGIDLHVLRPNAPAATEGAAPVLRLLAKVAGHSGDGTRAIYLMPGLADIMFGTPPALVHESWHAILARLETVCPRADTDYIFVMPVVNPVLCKRAGPYLSVYANLVEERHLHGISIPDKLVFGSWGKQNERLYPDVEVRSAVWKNLAARTDMHCYQLVLRICAGVLGLALLLFLILQWRTHRRLQRLIAISCAPVETAPAEPSAE